MYVKREVTDSPERKIERITVNEVTTRKKSLPKRFAEAFIGGDDARTVIAYVVLEVILPATKDLVVDAGTQALERAFFGDGRPSNRRSLGSRPGYTNYSRYSQTTRPEPREVSRVARARHDFDEVVISTRAEADQVLSTMYEVLERYDSISVADFYDLVGVSSGHTDHKWGWEKLSGVRILRVNGGFILDLPKPEPLR